MYIYSSDLDDMHFSFPVQDKLRLERLKHILKLNDTQTLLPKIEEEWCLSHNVVPSSLHNIAGICMYCPANVIVFELIN